MARATRHSVSPAEEEESYFASMTDVVIGLLFIFIIMLMFFAMRFQQATEEQRKATQDQIEVTEQQQTLIDELTDSEAARGQVLRSLGDLLQKDGINVVILPDEGILRFPEEILFEKSSWDLTVKGTAALKSLAKALDAVLPCFTRGPRSREDNCPKVSKAKIEAIFIEGHADADPYRNPVNARSVQAPPSTARAAGQSASTERGGALFGLFRAAPQTPPSTPSAPAAGTTEQRKPSNLPPQDNLDLSALRATSTFRELVKTFQGLTDYKSPDDKSVLSVSGYGEYRPVARSENEVLDNYKKRNRRIDLRILMATSTAEEAKRRQQTLSLPAKRP